MYAPGRPDFSGWWVVVGLTADGREIDPITGGAPTLEKPDPTTDHYRSLGGYYWSDFPDEEGEAYTTYRRFLLWQDRRRNPPERQLTHMTVIYMYETFLPINNKSHPPLALLIGPWAISSSEVRSTLHQGSMLVGVQLYKIDYELLGTIDWRPVALPRLQTY